MALPRIEITTNGVVGTVIKVNGVKVDGVRSFKVEQNAGEIPALKMELIATDLTLDGVALPILPDVLSNYYEPKKITELYTNKD